MWLVFAVVCSLRIAISISVQLVRRARGTYTHDGAQDDANAVHVPRVGIELARADQGRNGCRTQVNGALTTGTRRVMGGASIVEYVQSVCLKPREIGVWFFCPPDVIQVQVLRATETVVSIPL